MLPNTTTSRIAVISCVYVWQVDPTDSELLNLLDVVKLGHLAARVGGLDAELDWGATLSQGSCTMLGN